MDGDTQNDAPLTPYEQLCELSAAIARVYACRLRGDTVGEARGRRWLADLPAIEDMVRAAESAECTLGAGHVALPVGLANEPTEAGRERVRCLVLAALCQSALVLLDHPDSLQPTTEAGRALTLALTAVAHFTGVDP